MAGMGGSNGGKRLAQLGRSRREADGSKHDGWGVGMSGGRGMGDRQRVVEGRQDLLGDCGWRDNKSKKKTKKKKRQNKKKRGPNEEKRNSWAGECFGSEGERRSGPREATSGGSEMKGRNTSERFRHRWSRAHGQSPPSVNQMMSTSAAETKLGRCESALSPATDKSAEGPETPLHRGCW